jgi:DNA topoisomerase-1
MPLVVEMPGKCPGCGSRILKRTSRNGYTYYACEKGRECPWRGVGIDGKELIGFMTFDVPVKDNCPVCGRTMFKKAGRGAKKPFCIHEDCSNFTPEDKRGGWKKPAEGEEKKTAGKKTGAKKTAAKKTSAKKTAAKKAK